jgi:hypothetical protein
MANGTPDDDYLSPKDMRYVIEQEIKDSAKAHELRTRELTELATVYEQGKITPEQADERMDRYQHRWGEALRGASAMPNVTDEEILAKIDGTRRQYVTPRDSRDQVKRLFGGDQSGKVPSR